MRIAYLTGEYPRVTDTFIQREVAALRQQGVADGVTVQTFSVRSPPSLEALSAAQKAECANTQYLLPPRPFALLRAHTQLIVSRPRLYLQTLLLAWKTRQLGLRGTLYQLIYFLEAGLLAQWLNRENITHLHNHFGDSSCTVAMLASALGGFSYSFTLHGPGIFFEPYRWRLDAKIRRAKFVSCISHFCRSQAMIFAPIETWPNLHIVHCGVDPQMFASSSDHSSDLFSDCLAPGAIANQANYESTQSSPTQDSQRLLYVGRLAAAKGLPVLLESLAKLKHAYPNVHLTVVGDGADRLLLEAQVAHLGLETQVSFVGYQSPAAVRQYLQAADIFVMSSFAEGVPVVLMEAMMAGLPVVATQVAGISELVEEGMSGFLVPPSDPKALSDRIQILLADSSLRQRLGNQGKITVSQNFNIHQEAHKLYQLMTGGDIALAAHRDDQTVSDPKPLALSIS